MPARSKSHWAALLAVGLPLVVGGCAGSGMGIPTGQPPSSAKAPQVDALTLGDRLKAEGNFSAAVSMYQQAHRANPSDIRPVLGLGEVLLGMSANSDAAQTYGAALTIQPNNLEALRGLGHARILLGQPQFALTHYQTALKIAPNDTRILNGLGVAQDMIGDHGAAQKAYHRVLAVDPNNQSAKNNLALSMALAGDNAGAIKILEEVSKSSGATSVNRQNLALVYGVSGQIAQAEEASRGDLPKDVVSRNMAAMSANTDAGSKQEMLKGALGVELKGRQYAPASKPVTPLTTLAQTSSLESDTPYMSGQEGAALPVITTDRQTGNVAAVPPNQVVVVRAPTGDAWSDDWDEELVDASDIDGASGKQTTSSTSTDDLPPAPSSTAKTAQSAGPTPFLSSSSAIADDKSTGAGAATTPPSSQPTAASSASTPEIAQATPAKTPTAATTTSTATEQPPTVASATPASKPDAAAASTSTPAPTAAANEKAETVTATAQSFGVAKMYTVQLASYRSEAEATVGWQTLTSEQKDLLATLPHAVAKADLGTDKGVFYRLQAGSFSDRKDAKALCSDLQDRSIDCMVVEAASTAPAPAKTQQSMLAPNDSFVVGAR